MSCRNHPTNRMANHDKVPASSIWACEHNRPRNGCVHIHFLAGYVKTPMTIAFPIAKVSATESRSYNFRVRGQFKMALLVLSVIVAGTSLLNFMELPEDVNVKS